MLFHHSRGTCRRRGPAEEGLTAGKEVSKASAEVVGFA